MYAFFQLGFMFLSVSGVYSMMSITDVYYVESTRLPVYLSCEKRYSYIEVGGVTLNSSLISDVKEKHVKKECEDQLKEPWKLADQPKTTCYLTFGKKFQKRPDDVIRVIYRCFDTKPKKSPAWGKKKGAGKVYTAKQKSSGKDIVLKCSRDRAMIIVKNAYINGEAADTSVHTSLDKNKIRVKCYGQWVAVLSDPKAKKGQTECLLPNEKSYGGELTIEYLCTVPPATEKEEVLKKPGKTPSKTDDDEDKKDD